MRRKFFLSMIVFAMFFLSSCSVSRRPGTSGNSGNSGKTYQYTQPRSSDPVEESQSSGDPVASGAVANAAARVRPSVVGISATHIQRDKGMGRAEAVEGVGSGLIVSADGYILTNDHVVFVDNARKSLLSISREIIKNKEKNIIAVILLLTNKKFTTLNSGY